MRHRQAVLLLILTASRGVGAAPHPMAATAAQQVLRAGGTAACDRTPDRRRQAAVAAD